MYGAREHIEQYPHGGYRFRPTRRTPALRKLRVSALPGTGPLTTIGPSRAWDSASDAIFYVA
jgi:hypothetical protein